MAKPLLSKKTAADLARFCAVKSVALSRMQAKIGETNAPDANLIAAFDEAAHLLEAATEELRLRIEQP